jgi:urease accessory protein
LKLELLHLCDSLFPIGAFAYSDGLEAATSGAWHVPGTCQTGDGQVPGKTRYGQVPGTCQAPSEAPIRAPTEAPIRDADALGAWLDVVLDESIGRSEGPAVWQAWLAVVDGDWPTLAALDEELTAIRPSSASRSSSRAMGHRLLTTWRALHPDERLAHVPPSTALPIAFAAACACGGVDRRESVEAYAYTRLAATTSAAMRLMPIGQTDAHRLLAGALHDVPRIVERVIVRGGRIESFSPALDIAAMTQQYLHSRLFRS